MTKRTRAPRAVLGGILALALAVPTSAHAGTHAGTYTGSVLLPTYHPWLAAMAYRTGDFANGLVGYVIELHGTVPSGTPYKIKKLSGNGPMDFDVYFARELPLNPIGDALCGLADEQQDGPDQERGNTQCAADYAIVVLTPGVAVAGTFRLTV